jgi:hypothetical protein
MAALPLSASGHGQLQKQIAHLAPAAPRRRKKTQAKKTKEQPKKTKRQRKKTCYSLPFEEDPAEEDPFSNRPI